MLLDYLNLLLPTLAHFAAWGYWAIFFIAFAEALAFVGTFIPGALAVIFAGFLASQGVYSVGDLIWFAALGAIAGDVGSYWLGTKGTRFFSHENRFLKIAHIDRGKAFFKRYGPKSILLGRFVGPIRAILPFVAGLSRMEMGRFLFWNVLSGFLWAATHVLVGYFFGDAYGSLAALSRRAATIGVVGVLSVAAVWLVVANAAKMLSYAQAFLGAVGETLFDIPVIRRFLARHPRLVRFGERRFDRAHFTGRPLTLFVLAAAVIVALFAQVAESLIEASPIVYLDQQLELALYALRDPALAKFFLWVTFLGNGYVVVALAAGVGLFFFLWGARYELVAGTVTLFGTEAFVFAGKELVERARPSGLIPYYTENTFSFPSEHAAFGIAFFGFLAYIIARRAPLSARAKFSVGLIAFIVSIFIAFSRLYLGVHYLSDVIGGYLLGLLWLVIGIAVNEWLHAARPLRPSSGASQGRRLRKAALMGTGVALALAELVFFVQFTSADKLTYNTGSAPGLQVSGSPADVLSQVAFPQFADNAFSEAHYPISFIIASPDEATLVSALSRAGWHEAASLSFASLAGLMHPGRRPTRTRPVLPALWLGQPDDLAFVRQYGGRGAPVHFVRIWKTPYVAADGDAFYALETSSSDRAHLVFSDSPATDFAAERELLYSDLEKAGVLSSIASRQFSGVLVEATFSGEENETDGKVYVVTVHD